MTSLHVPRVTVGLLALAALACGGGQRESVVPMDGCAPVDGPLAANADLSALLGEHELVLVATSGERDGATTEGTFTLRALDDASGWARDDIDVPYYGSTDVDLGAVGAIQLGGTTSMDPEATLARRRIVGAVIEAPAAKTSPPAMR